ncbi:hypothetical protein B0H66DRAFT_106856 [Apodospora peruviana]|uniref:Short-chain dehydrogenases/reductase n=1 Tax=Apodospora peruviana TaxID=516989 RepID=A0AAE0IHB2_9PEZI|nr:hypothetical protein B0H66DRAFT_106856 [Apodospora peruviana]
MVSLEQIRSSNSQIATALPPGLVAVFVGATGGIGETSMKQFAKNAVKPRIYFIGRSKESGNRIRKELLKLNPEGEYFFFSVDASLLRAVDDVCRQIEEHECQKDTAINLLFLSTGTLVSGDTEEGLPLALAVSYYARMRFIVNLMPLIQNASHLRRVVSVFAGTKEGAVDTNDLQCRSVSMFTSRGHFSSMMTFALEGIAKKAPSVSFVHDFPGMVKTNFGSDVKGVMFTVLRAVWNAFFFVVGPFVSTPFDEAGERQVYFSTSGRFPAGGQGGVPLPKDVEVAFGTDGKTGSGIYSIDNHGESAPPETQQLLDKMRKEGTAEKVWSFVEEEFVRITGIRALRW